MSAPAPVIREYRVDARSTDVFGRVLVSAREHHFVVDGPVQNGCPGEELTPPELFLSAVAASTNRLRLISSATILPRRRPHLVAQAAATLDLLSGGRLTIGVGAGGDPPDFEAFGEPADARTPRARAAAPRPNRARATKARPAGSGTSLGASTARSVSRV